MSRKRSKVDGAVMPVRLAKEMQNRIRKVSDKAHLSDADIMRLAIDRGLAAVEKMFEPQTSVAA